MGGKLEVPWNFGKSIELEMAERIEFEQSTTANGGGYNADFFFWPREYVGSSCSASE